MLLLTASSSTHQCPGAWGSSREAGQAPRDCRAVVFLQLFWPLQV